MSDQRPGKSQRPGQPPRATKAERKNEAREKARRMREEAERRQKRNRVLIAVVAVVAVLAVVLGIGLIVRQASDSGTDAAAPSNVGDAGQILVGQSDAPVTVSVYLDYQCPACKAFEDANQTMLESLQEEGKIKIEYHPISILDRFSGGTMYSTRSAGAAMCVADQAPEAFPEFNKQMFANQPPENAQGLTNEKVATIATLAGAPESISTCIDDGTYEDYATRATEQASEAGLPGTPWVKVDGQVVEGATQPGVLQAAIQAALGDSGGQPAPSATTSPASGTPSNG
jgi:protein-disulfide isomerase